MLTLTKLQSYLSNVLYFDSSIDLPKIDPYMANGLQVKGKEKIVKIGFGVSASLALFKLAQEARCDALVVHHSVNLPPYNRYDRIFQERLGFLLKHGVSLFGYHFLLDAHPEVGHNALVLRQIGAEPVEPYLHKGDPWGHIGRFKVQGSRLKVIKKKLEHLLSEDAVWYEFGPEEVRNVVALSGKGAPYPGEMQELIDKQIDLFITGEVHEWNRELFREAKINFVAGGHYCTEVLGLRKLEEKVRADLKVKTVFLNLPNAV